LQFAEEVVLTMVSYQGTTSVVPNQAFIFVIPRDFRPEGSAFLQELKADG